MDQEIRLKLYNTETRTKEDVMPLDGHTIRLYTCGPTVYNFAHIGNFRTYVFEDLLRRSLKFFGMPVIQVMNITDIDDKTLAGAIQKKITLQAFTQPFTQAFFEDLEVLGIEKVEYYPLATDYVPEMIEIVQKLLETGIAYRGADESIYFSIDRFPSYGRLSHLHLGELKKGASNRVFCDEYDKENAADFVLWKAYDPQRDGEIFWQSPFGKGRPGWHIECSAMAMKLLGESIDMHVGGVDNMFPHHENEIAQSEAYSCKHFVKHWLHAEHLLVEHRKMSKSLGNFYTLRDLLAKGYTGQEVRYLLLQTHYRTQLNFTFQGLDAARASLERFSDFILRLRQIDQQIGSGDVLSLLEKTKVGFMNALADDLNISLALASIFDMLREINGLCDTQRVSSQDANATLELLSQLNCVLNVLPLQPKEISIPKELQEALEQRERARAEKNWKKADECRDLILSQGYLIEDTPSGARLKKR